MPDPASKWISVFPAPGVVDGSGKSVTPLARMHSANLSICAWGSGLGLGLAAAAPGSEHADSTTTANRLTAATRPHLIPLDALLRIQTSIDTAARCYS